MEEQVRKGQVLRLCSLILKNKFKGAKLSNEKFNKRSESILDFVEHTVSVTTGKRHDRLRTYPLAV